MTPIRTVARALLGGLFVTSGVLALRNPDRLLAKAQPVIEPLTPALEAAHLPADATTLVKANAAAQVAGGLMLATGTLTRPAAAVLAASMVPSTVAAHPFWNERDPQRRAEQEVQFAKNLGLLAGLLYAAVDRNGRPSLAWRTRYAAKYARSEAKRARTAASAAGAVTVGRASGAAKRAGDAVSHTVGDAGRRAGFAAQRASDLAGYAGKSVRRSARTAKREAKLAVRAANFGRRLPF